MLQFAFVALAVALINARLVFVSGAGLTFQFGDGVFYLLTSSVRSNCSLSFSFALEDASSLSFNYSSCSLIH
jgi:hypothetical protein